MDFWTKKRYNRLDVLAILVIASVVQVVVERM